MRLGNNNLALIILIFTFLSAVGNTVVWMNITGSFPTGRASAGEVNVCIDVPPILRNIRDLVANTTLPFTYQLNATDSGRPIYFYANASGLGSFSMNSSGFINFTPGELEAGNHTITVWVTHNTCPGAINWSSFVMSIFLLNTPPYWINITETDFPGLEDQLFTLNLSINATDHEDSAVFFAVNRSLAVDFADFTMTPEGFINFTPRDTDVCRHELNITIKDEHEAMNSSLFNFTILGVNDPPFLNYTPDQQACEDNPYYLQVKAWDNDILYDKCTNDNYHFYENSTIFVIEEYSGVISFIPTVADVSDQYVRLYVTDGALVDYQDLRFTVIELNDPPILQAIGSKTLRANRTLYINADANDEESGSDPNANLTFNSTFLSGTSFFSINSSTGEINVTTNDSLNGTYLVRICANDTGLLNPHPNATSFCGDGSPKGDCEDVSIVITTTNLPPNITSYIPTTNVTMVEGDTVNFSLTAYDPEGGALTLYWNRNYTPVAYNIYNYSFVTYIGDAGEYNLTVNVSDGELNATLTWIVNVLQYHGPPGPSAGGGGGGGGGACGEIWSCTDWSFCQNATPVESQIILKTEFGRVISDCSKNKIPKGKCGFQIRGCKQTTDCKIVFKKPIDLQTCIFTLFPNCFDGIKNCHDGSCEILADCGGPCKECPTCSDGIKNQGEDWIDCGGPCPPCKVEYPKPPKCGDDKCDLSEMLTCRKDCGFFWFSIMLAIILLTIIALLSSREIVIMRQKAIKSEKAKREKYIGSLVGLTRQTIASKNLKLAKQLYTQLSRAYNELPEEGKKGVYAKLVKLYAEIEKLEQENQ